MHATHGQIEAGTTPRTLERLSFTPTIRSAFSTLDDDSRSPDIPLSWRGNRGDRCKIAGELASWRAGAGARPLFQTKEGYPTVSHRAQAKFQRVARGIGEPDFV